MTDNAEIARLFTAVADMLEIQGADSFRVSAYRRVARTVEDLAQPLTSLSFAEIAQLPGIGKSSAEKLRDLLESGRLAVHDELSREVPPDLLQLLQIPHLGPKKVSLLWKQRGIASLADLKAALEGDALADLKGFGERTLTQLREGIAFVERAAGRTRLARAWEIAEELRAAVQAIPGVTRVETAGSLRRGAETIGDIDLLCCAADGEAVVRAFTALPAAQRVLAAGGTKGSILAADGGERLIQVDLRVVPQENFGAAWQYFTGSKEHNVRLRELATRRGLTLNEYALSEVATGRVVVSREEADIYAALELPWIPPELREGRGELELRATPPLLQLSDMRGDLHMHTTASDGRASIEEMVQAARTRGYAYVCITDHSRSSVIAGGLSPERLEQHVRDIRAAAARHRDIRVLAGAEVDILADGSLDYPDELLAQLDWVVASVHVGMGRDAEINTQRSIAALRNPYVNVLAHPTGRLLGRRDAMPLDIDAVARVAAESGAALELNASAFRLDLKDQHLRQASGVGALICINCDAHGPEQFDQMRFGVLTARRAGLTRDNVLNTRSVEELLAFVAAKRTSAAARAAGGKA